LCFDAVFQFLGKGTSTTFGEFVYSTIDFRSSNTYRLDRVSVLIVQGGGAWVHLAAQPVDGELELVVHGGRRGPRPVRVLLDGPLQNLAHNGTMGIIY
jgi:hypothetical protein